MTGVTNLELYLTGSDAQAPGWHGPDASHQATTIIEQSIYNIQQSVITVVHLPSYLSSGAISHYSYITLHNIHDYSAKYKHWMDQNKKRTSRL